MQDALMHGKTGANPLDLVSLFEAERMPVSFWQFVQSPGRRDHHSGFTRNFFPPP